MDYLATAVIGAGALGLVNLWLIVAMAHKLRGQSDQIVLQSPQPMPRQVVGPPPGDPVPDFGVTTVTGDVLSAADLNGQHALIGFFMPGCAPCHEQIPEFIEFARGLTSDSGQVIAVVSPVGRPTAPAREVETGRLIEQLAQAGVYVVSGPSAREATKALAITGYPSFVLLGADGRVQAGAHSVAGLGDLPALASSA
jgi:hypothetical protein